ncbi:uncharacterized protein BP01DRAFT_363359 [Aspergillus saccharolyticus JOP 1030-1]|uniref:Uncharacterized protein n=1 Tax=Aspergillus saccharolyticus JOP 1030-1 TaxID=1450539 RepID=A0A318ZMI6_9EURO|nr:hypothetical protein BP01DRAFT_363359 [Aspergillus saccharolyticus JOP 1030-1]PYH48187.1 hypothetical protein BP01DRAFT_363359 [Aspergillus saccharolyticus JOP 1030-1]
MAAIGCCMSGLTSSADGAHRQCDAPDISKLRSPVQQPLAARPPPSTEGPIRSGDSMIDVPPQKDGDDSDPRMQLNYAHREPEADSNARNASTPPIDVILGYGNVQSPISQLCTEMELESGIGPLQRS